MIQQAILWARFLRVPLLPTIWSHLLMAHWVSQTELDGWVFVTFSSIYLYGMGDNDWVDRFRDAIKAPERPLPSKKLSESAAQRGLSFLLLVALFSLFFVSSNQILWAAVGALVMATIYNHLTKDHVFWGPLSLALARASVVAGLAVPWLVPLMVGGAAGGITWWSTTEEKYPQRKRWTLRFLLLLPLLDGVLCFWFLGISMKILIFLVAPVLCWALVKVLRKLAKG